MPGPMTPNDYFTIPGARIPGANSRNAERHPDRSTIVTADNRPSGDPQPS